MSGTGAAPGTAAVPVGPVGGAGGKKGIPSRSPPSLTPVTAPVPSPNLTLRISTLPRSRLGIVRGGRPPTTAVI